MRYLFLPDDRARDGPPRVLKIQFFPIEELSFPLSLRIGSRARSTGQPTLHSNLVSQTIEADPIVSLYHLGEEKRLIHLTLLFLFIHAL